MFPHPTKGYPYFTPATPPPFPGLSDWIARSFGRVKAAKLAATLFRPATVSQMLRRAR